MESCRWWNEETLALVTGANKGIGIEVCKQLAEKGLKVILTARNEERGREAVEVLAKQGLHNVQFHPLDVQDEKSVATLALWLLENHGGLDILINNAAVNGIVIDHKYVKENNLDPLDILFKLEIPQAFVIEYDSSKVCIDANYHGAKHVAKALIPLLRPSLNGARIVNVGSTYGQLHHLQSKTLQEELANINSLSESYIDKLLDSYLEDVKSKNLEHNVWPLMHPSYKMSKVALHAYTRILAKDMEKRGENQKVFVNCVHPGFVKTDITTHQGNIVAEEGAKNVVRVALLPPEVSPSGKFFFEDQLFEF